MLFLKPFKTVIRFISSTREFQLKTHSLIIHLIEIFKDKF